MNIQYPFLLIYRNESQPSVFVHTAAQDAQGGSGKLKNDEEVPLPTTEDGGDEDEDEDDEIHRFLPYLYLPPGTGVLINEQTPASPKYPSLPRAPPPVTKYHVTP